MIWYQSDINSETQVPIDYTKNNVSDETSK